MGTKLGVHVATGARNGYGEVVSQAPAAVVAIGEHGSLMEAWEKSGHRTITIYRDITVFVHGNAPHDFPQMSEEQARAAADEYWPHLRAVYDTHPADYYQPTNEIGGGGAESIQSFQNLVAFETRLMELAEAEPNPGRYKLAVASLAGGSPTWELWLEYFVPLIARAGQGGHIYSRHAYGPGLLTQPGPVPTDGNAGRPFREAEELRRRGIKTPMIITEAGPNAGYEFPGTAVFMDDVKRYDQLCQQHDNIWGFCCWTYGNYHGEAPNIQDASTELSTYLASSGGAQRVPYPASTSRVGSNGTAQTPPVVAVPPTTNGHALHTESSAIPRAPGNTLVGIHASADSGFGVGWENPVREEYRQLQPQLLKFMSNHDPSMIGRVVYDARHTAETIIVRAFLDWGNRRLTTDDFLDYTLSDVVRTVNAIRAQGIQNRQIIIELHNEPNLRVEGYNWSWTDGRACVAFFSEVLQGYKAAMPNVRYGLGALSPGSDINDEQGRFRAGSKQFFLEMKSHPGWHTFDVHLVHLYTIDNWVDDIWWLDHCQRHSMKPIWITESSWHTHDYTSGEAYAAKLVELVELLDQRPTKGVAFYCMSASNPDFYHEAWCRSIDKYQPHVGIASRNIAAEVRRLRPLQMPVRP